MKWRLLAQEHCCLNFKPGWGPNRITDTQIFGHVSHDKKLFASAAGIQSTTAALVAALMEREQLYPCSGVLP
jgi:hypothetical protein